MVSRAGTLCQSIDPRELIRSRGARSLTVFCTWHDVVERNDHLVHHIWQDLPELVCKWTADASFRCYIRVVIAECILRLYHLEQMMLAHTTNAPRCLATHPFLSLQSRHRVIRVLSQLVVHIPAADDDKPLVRERDLEDFVLLAMSRVAMFSAG